jgi:hypothetical protein
MGGEGSATVARLRIIVTEEEVLAFVQSSFKSVWVLEVLLTLRRDAARSWHGDELVRELRSSQVVVTEALNSLRNLGMVKDEPGGTFAYQPASPTLDALAAAMAGLYAVKPTSVIRAISLAPNEKLRIFSDAFRLKGD